MLSPRLLAGLAILVPSPLAAAAEPPALAAAAAGDLRVAVSAARDAVFPTLIHIEPVLERSVGGRKIDTMVRGSGVILREDGLAVTNYHVAGNAKRLIVTLADRRTIGARLIGADAATDLALIQLELASLGLDRVPAASFAQRPVKEGDFVMAMGSPLGLTRSLSLGVVSCSDRYLGELRLDAHLATGVFNTWIQTDAAINPGNSGGPLVDLDGRIVGINSRGYDKADNLGFAIPAAFVADIVARILKDGAVVRSRSGIAVQPLPSQVANGSEAAASRGALVASVDPGSPAQLAGVMAGDVLLSYGGTPLDVRFVEDLPFAHRVLTDAPVGAKVALEVARGCESLALSLVTEAWQPPQEEDLEIESVGLTLRTLAERERRDRFLTERGGVLLTGARVGGAVRTSRPPLKVGDVVLAVNGNPVATAQDVAFELEDARGVFDEHALLVVARGRSEWRISIQLPPREDEVAAARGDSR
jgi:serine protease Do